MSQSSIGSYHIWRLIGKERVIVDGLFQCEEYTAHQYADSLTELTGKVHVAVQIGSTYEIVLLPERAKFLAEEEQIMATLNHFQGIGRLGQDPELNYTPNGTAVTKFSLAIDQGKDEKPMWLTIVCWEKLAETMNELLWKGALVYVQGRLSPRTYVGKDKKDHVSLDIIAGNVQLLEKRKTGSNAGESDQQSQAS